MKCFIRKVTFLVVFVAGFTGLGVSVQAEKLNFSVTPIISSSQRQDVKTYFDLRVTPGVDEVLQVEVENLSDQDMTVLASANTVVTNDNVIADYSQHDPEINHTLKYPFSDIAKIDPEIKLKPKEKKW